MKRRVLFRSIICLLGLVILVGLVPVIIGSIINKNRLQQSFVVANQAKTAKPEVETSKPKKSELLLMVSGKISIVEDGGVSFVILTSSYGKRYILTGPKSEELKGISKDVEITVVGIPKPPLLEQIKGERIKRTIEVKNFQIKESKNLGEK